MKTLLSIFRYTWVTAWYAIAISVVLLAVLFSGMRLLLPYAVDYRSEIQNELSRYIGQPVNIDTLDAEWRGLEPSLVLKNVTLLDAGGETAVLQFQKIRLGLDWLASLALRDVVFSGITLVGLDLTLTKFADGHIALQGLTDRGGNQDLDALTGWLFSQGELRIEDSDLTWVDQRLENSPKLQLADVNVLLRNVGQQHWLDVSLTLPEYAGESLSLSVEMHGNPLAPAKGRKTRLYVEGTAINFAGLLPELQILGIETGVENADFQLWMDWRNGEIQKVQGTAELKAITLAGGSSTGRTQHSVDRLAGQINWQKNADGWRFDGDNIVLIRGDDFWLPSRVSLSYLQTASPNVLREEEAAVALPAQLDLAVSFLRLDRLSELLPVLSSALSGDETVAEGGQQVAQKPAQQLLQALQGINLRGEIHDLRATWQTGDDTRLQSYARFESLISNAWNRVPPVSDAKGQLWLKDNAGQVLIEQAVLAVKLPDLFRDPLPLDYLSGQIAWRTGAGGWHLMARNLRAGNPDIRTRVTLDLQKTADHPSPFISLVGSFSDADGRRVSRYLPVGILGEHTVDWLDYAIKGGHVSTGGVILHGRLADFPYDAGNGHFEVRFQVQDALLDYAQAWPPLSDIGAEVLFRGRAMEINAERGRIFQSDIRWAKVVIEDMQAEPVVVTVRGDVDGPTQEKLDYLIQSPPLREKFGQYLEILRAEGRSLLSLDMALPIQEMEDSRVSGTLHMDDNALFVPPLGEVLSRTQGTLHFSSDGLQAEAMSADLLGQPVVMDILRTANGQTRFHATGRFDAVDLSRRYLPQVSDLLQGGSEWDVSLDVPMDGQSSTQQAVVLRVKSSMLGVAARLPSPLTKSADDLLPLKLRVSFPPAQEPVLRLAYGGFLSGIFEFGEGGPMGLHRGELRFSTDAAVLPEQPGLRVAGWLDTFSLDDWGSILGPGDGKGAAWLLSTDLAVREAEVFGQKLHNLKLKVVAEEWYWQAQVESQELKGLLQIPRSNVHRPLVVELEYCRLDSLNFAADPEATTDPRSLPPLKVHIGDLRYKQRRFGGLQLETVPVHNGLKIKQLLLTPRKTRLSASGGWFVRGSGEQYSKFDIQVESENVERTLKAFGYLDSIRGGKGTVALSLQWPGSPVLPDDNMELVRGRASMDLREGQLLDVDPGAGRLFGLLSLQTLPRRLLLDFADVFREGFRFDRIRGDFLIEDGDAYTSNLYMTGPAARVDISGRTGLVAKDYDQLVTVTPKISETLPLIGALALTSPQIGAAILFVQKIMEPQINKATQTQYNVTGSWESPDVVKLQ
ncbi:hypothetical protein MNBD_GAMMA20-958 [hydrothermal vent metagenome]|uniref:YhdP central domain-containing protein n=1 Tax=hydrothermal vent metagenome TaxID=652676 RepID=A0A3B1AD08_9ZZZZ